MILATELIDNVVGIGLASLFLGVPVLFLTVVVIRFAITGKLPDID